MRVLPVGLLPGRNDSLSPSQTRKPPRSSLTLSKARVFACEPWSEYGSMWRVHQSSLLSDMIFNAIFDRSLSRPCSKKHFMSDLDRGLTPPRCEPKLFKISSEATFLGTEGHAGNAGEMMLCNETLGTAGSALDTPHQHSATIPNATVAEIATVTTIGFKDAITGCPRFNFQHGRDADLCGTSQLLAWSSSLATTLSPQHHYFITPLLATSLVVGMTIRLFSSWKLVTWSGLSGHPSFVTATLNAASPQIPAGFLGFHRRHT